MKDQGTEDLAKEFLAKEYLFESLCGEVKFSLTRKLDEASIKWHSVTARTKSLTSFLEKVERKEYSDPFAETEDIAGVRIVCLFMVDLQRAGDVISSMYEVLNREDKVTGGDASAFGYMSHHYVCRLSNRYAGERYDALKGLKFEIQVRTILMDAWANMSHYLSYKNAESIPKALIKDFYALSGLLYVGDRQFESLFKASSLSAASAEDRILRSSEIDESEVNADTVQALLARIFPDRGGSTAEGVSDFVFELRENGYNDLAGVGRILENNRRAAVRSEKDSFIVDGDTGERGKFNRVGIARAAFDIHDAKFEEYRRVRNRNKRAELDDESDPRN